MLFIHQFYLTLCTLSGPIGPNTKIYVTEDFLYIDFLNEF